MTHQPNRKDGRYMDFEEITAGSVIFVDKEHNHNLWDMSSSPMPNIHFMPGDIWVVESLANRPRVAVIRHLQSGERSGIRVDMLLMLDDKDVLTIGPG